MLPDLGLSPLLAALRQAGVRVGVTETARLQHIFSLEPDLSHDTAVRLKTILRAVLAKDLDQRETIDQVVAVWLGTVERELRALDASAQEIHIPPVPVPKRRWWRPWRIAALVMIVLLALLSSLPRRRSPTPVAPSIQVPVTKKPAPSAPALTQNVDMSKRTFRSEVPFLTVEMPEPVWDGWIPLILGTIATTLAVALWLALRKRRWLPEPAPLPKRKGPPRVFPVSPVPLEPQLLERRQQETLVWGISHFVAEEPSQKIDLAASVRATARAGGLPQIRFQQARHFREVWLWVDDAADDPALPRLAQEIELVLHEHGLPVERATFHGIPRLLMTPTGQVFEPGEIDELRDTALVAILTDGRMLSRQHTLDDRRVVLDGLLRGLSHWPHLVFVDFSAGANDLAAILARHDLEAVSPAGLADFLGASRQARIDPAQQRSTGEDKAWAAAAALAPSPLDEASVFELRRALGLRVSPWALNDLRREGLSLPGRLWWPAPVRARRLGWLSTAEQHTGRVASGSLLDRALDFWESVYDREKRRRESNEAASPWAGTPAQQHLVMERAFLRLWRHPGAAARELYGLYQGALREVIQNHLAMFAPSGRSGADQVEFPWKWNDRSATERAMLQEMGLGGGLPFATLRQPSRLWIGIGVCAGLALGALGFSGIGNWSLPNGAPSMESIPKNNPGLISIYGALLLRATRFSINFVHSHENEPDYQVTTMDRTGTLKSIRMEMHFDSNDFYAARFGGIFNTRYSNKSEVPRLSDSGIDTLFTSFGEHFYRVSAANRHWAEDRLVRPGSKVRIRWQIEEKSCISEKNGTETWHCGASNNNPPPLPGVQRSIAILNPGPRPKEEVRALAAALLDSGSVDVVAISSDWTHIDLSRLMGPSLRRTDCQLLLFSWVDTPADKTNISGLKALRAKHIWAKVSNWQYLTASLSFDGIKPAHQALVSGVQSLGGDTDKVFLRRSGGGQ